VRVKKFTHMTILTHDPYLHPQCAVKRASSRQSKRYKSADSKSV